MVVQCTEQIVLIRKGMLNLVCTKNKQISVKTDILKYNVYNCTSYKYNFNILCRTIQ